MEIKGEFKLCEAVERGLTIIEILKGDAKRVKFEESKLIYFFY